MKRSFRNKSATRPHSFHRGESPTKPRSRFKQPSKYTTTFDAGDLIPYYLKEVLPGDTISLSSTMIARLTTPLYPFMDNVHIDTQYFFVPSRLVWENWERFHGAQDNPTDSTDYLIPKVTCPPGGWPENSIADYFGIPTKVDGADVNALPFRALNLIRNEWYRDENLQNSSVVNLDDGPDDAADYPMLKRGKRHDYFNSALPWTQKGDPVGVPIGDVAPVIGIGKSDQNYDPTNRTVYETGATGTTTYDAATLLGDPSGMFIQEDPDNPGHPGVYADLSTATAATINDLRLAFQTQAYLELNARAGTRYPEYLLAQWGVNSPDARLQRPEYLGGGTQTMDTFQVPNTAQGVDALGNLGAYSQGVASHGFMRSFSEHGYVIGIVSARSDMTYQQGLPRMFSREDVLDFALPIFSHIGEQAILNKEIYFQGTPADEEPFGYTERYNEYRYEISKVTGRMRSNSTQPLDAWHLAFDFADLPVLSDSFIQEAPPIDRVIAVQDEPQFKLDVLNNCIATRCLPVRGTPGTLFRF